MMPRNSPRRGARGPTEGAEACWDPRDYAAHSQGQQDWARDLMSRLALSGNERILDVGCGDGCVTAELAAAVPRGQVVGIDKSLEMIRHAIEVHPAARHPNLRFALQDARDLRLAERFDVVFSNAALHWVDDHPAFLRGAAAVLERGGWLCVSCGGRGNAAAVFRALRSVLRDRRWRCGFRRMPPPYFFHGPEAYGPWLMEAGLQPVRVELVPRDLTFADRIGMVGWVRTTWLPYTQRVPEPLRDVFIEAVVERYLADHPPAGAGSVTVRMVRLEILAQRI